MVVATYGGERRFDRTEKFIKSTDFGTIVSLEGQVIAEDGAAIGRKNE